MLDSFIYLDTTLIFIISLFIGSFLGVLVDRIVRGEQFVSGRSHCDSCKNPLKTNDLIPLFSYLFLGGKCRYCKNSIPPTLFYIELTTAVSFATITYFFLNGKITGMFGLVSLYGLESIILLIVLYLLVAVLILIFFTDLKYQVIPDIYLWALGVLAIPYIFLTNGLTIGFDVALSHLLAAGWLYLFFWIIHVAFRGRAMGEGDVYLAPLLAIYLGFELSLVMWFIAFLSGAIIGILLILKGRKKMRSAIPFGPFLIFGAVSAFLRGKDLIDWYLGYL